VGRRLRGKRRPVTLWLQFAALAGVIVFAGSNLSKYGDVIAEKTGMGRTWVGVILMASVTSLPELITGVSSIVIFNLADLAVGNVLGACMFNMLTIALLDVLSGPTPISTRANQGQVLAAGFGVLMLGVAAGGDRQALHEVIRRHSLAVADAVAQGAPNDLLERLGADPAFAGIPAADLRAQLEPVNYTGRAARQVSEFLEEYLRPLLARARPLAAEAGSAEVRV